MRLISWNVNRRVVALPRQVDALARRGPDLVALQEVTQRTATLFRTTFSEIGLPFAVTGFLDGADLHPERSRRSGVMVASRWPLGPVRGGGVDAPWPERIVSVVVRTPLRPVEIHNVYVPNASTGPTVGLPLLKVETFEAIFALLSRTSRRPRLLCGDFNAPFGEEPDGTVIPFGRAGREADAELSIFRGLVRFGLRDAYRALHGYRREAFSWFGLVRGYRLDHIFASRSLDVEECEYLHECRISGLSDHAPIEAHFELRRRLRSERARLAP